jgi:hypothetical protein
MRQTIRILLSLFVLVAASSMAPGSTRATTGTTLYVAYGSDALDSGPGTSCGNPGYRSEDQLAIYNALNDAVAGDTVQLCEGEWLHTANGYYDVIPDNVTIQGLGAGVTVLDGDGSYYLLGLTQGSGVVIRDITFQNAFEDSYGAGLYFEYADATVIDCEFLSNTAEYGAGLAADTDSVIHVVNSVFDGNEADYGAALVAKNDASVTVTNSRFEDNSATHGGSGYGGAAVYNYGGVVSINRSVFVGNDTASTGAGVMVYDGPTTITNSTFTANVASQGPAIYAYGDDSDVTIRNSRFIDNINDSVDDGGAVTFEHNNSDLVMEGNTFQGNTGAYYGGAVEIWDVTGSISVVRNIFRNNSAIEGGALWIDIRGGTRDIRRNQFLDNRAVVGGAIAYECESVLPRRATAVLLAQNRYSRNVATGVRRTANVWATDYGCIG